MSGSTENNLALIWNTSCDSDCITMRMVTDKEDTVTATLSDKPPPTVYASLLMPTEEQKSSALHVLQVFFYVLFAIAVPLTLCNIIVFCQKEMRGATSVYVIGLSVAQLIYIIAYVILLILQETLASYSTSYVYWVYFMAATVYLSSVVRRASYVVMCVVSMERLYAVVRPLHIQDFFLSKYPVLSLSAVYIGTAVWHVYIIARSVVVGVKDERSGTIRYMPVRTELYYRHQAVNDGFGLAAKIILTYVGLGAQILLNVLTIWALRRHNTTTKAMRTPTADDEAKRLRERQLTVTILAATISYVILSLPFAFHNLFHTIFAEYKPFGKYNNLYNVVGSSVYNLTVISCAVDFICFVVLSSNYRNTLFRLLGIARKKSTLPGKVTETENTA